MYAVPGSHDCHAQKNLREDRGIGLTPDGDKKLLNSKYVLVSFQVTAVPVSTAITGCDLFHSIRR